MMASYTIVNVSLQFVTPSIMSLKIKQSFNINLPNVYLGYIDYLTSSQNR